MTGNQIKRKGQAGLPVRENLNMVAEHIGQSAHRKELRLFLTLLCEPRFKQAKSGHNDFGVFVGQVLAGLQDPNIR